MADVAKQTDEVTLTIDGVEVTAPKGALLIRVAEQLGIAIPRFCDHPLLPPAGACRQCLVDVEGQRKPVTSCTTPVGEGMVVRTHLTSEVARKAQEGIMEFLLINHPLDCPVCDKGGECPLQNQAMSTGRAETRFHDIKRTYPKPINLSTEVLLDRERCVQCARCTRFSEIIAGDPFIELMDRSADEQVNVYRDTMFGGEPADEQGTHSDLGDEPFQSYFSGNTIQICPVGALTSSKYRFRSRPFDLVSTPSVCEHCSAGCAQRTDHRRGKVMRRLAGDDPAVNEEWDCDKGRFGFRYVTATDRITEPLVRDAETGELRVAAWSEALAVAADGLRAARDAGRGVGVLPGGRLTVEDAYAYSKFARTALRSNDIDFRARPLSAEEAQFLAANVAGQHSPTYAEVEAAPAVVLAGLEPEEECPILFLRLRKGLRTRQLPIYALAPFRSRGFDKLAARLIRCVPGEEAQLLAEDDRLAEALSQPGAVLLVGERLATSPGGLSAAAAVAERTGARLAWVPRRAGERGAVEVGCLPGLLPGGRPVDDARARAELADVWGTDFARDLASDPGRDTGAILEAVVVGQLGALVVGGVDPADLADVRGAERALAEVPFLVSLELRHSAVTRHADVVLPVAAAVEKAGAYLNWEGRLRPFGKVLDPGTMTDARILDAIASQLGVTLGCGEVEAIRRELTSLPVTEAPQPAPPRVAAGSPPVPEAGQAVLASWHQLIDEGSMLVDEEPLAGTARPAVARIGKEFAAKLGVGDGDPVTVGTSLGAVTLPAEVVDDLVGQVVWLPTNSPGATVRRTLGVTAGALVDVTVAGGVQ
ncbi:NADH-quinone oxidoreductase subunit G [Natronosporangium hydrolyticum]|uniref:NADH-quinone oxidoreductase n=1 Tax=Natronosporangium hydrolyticum TaxID=2811111 RepID=A0A895YDU2_9ACTN|nr:NADH-quinone oxidoreductase subunit G [Natronosporangium hydrolyticum]QSB14342.1 NADH-quinone oxidoreductase subunit G [Natronosporangium hydrolyticum]